MALKLATIHACVMAKGTKLHAKVLGTNVTRPRFRESVTLASQETRHPWGQCSNTVVSGLLVLSLHLLFSDNMQGEGHSWIIRMSCY